MTTTIEVDDLNDYDQVLYALERDVKLFIECGSRRDVESAQMSIIERIQFLTHIGFLANRLAWLEITEQSKRERAEIDRLTADQAQQDALTYRYKVHDEVIATTSNGYEIPGTILSLGWEGSHGRPRELDGTVSTPEQGPHYAVLLALSNGTERALVFAEHELSPAAA